MYSRSSPTDEHRALKRPELFLRKQVDHLEVSVDHESDVVVVVVDPDLLPLAVVQLPSALHLQLPDGASVEGEVEGQTILGGERHHE